MQKASPDAMNIANRVLDLFAQLLLIDFHLQNNRLTLTIFNKKLKKSNYFDNFKRKTFVEESVDPGATRELLGADVLAG
jgi:hypothetical protein